MTTFAEVFDANRLDVTKMTLAKASKRSQVGSCKISAREERTNPMEAVQLKDVATLQKLVRGGQQKPQVLSQKGAPNAMENIGLRRWWGGSKVVENRALQSAQLKRFPNERDSWHFGWMEKETLARYCNGEHINNSSHKPSRWSSRLYKNLWDIYHRARTKAGSKQLKKCQKKNFT